MFDGKRLTDAMRKLEPTGDEFEELIPRLERALELARKIKAAADAGPLTEVHALDVARLDALLEHVDRCLPDVEAWCVVKHYAGHVPGGSWEPRVWDAFLTKKQAEQFAPAIEKAYARGRERPEHRDRFLVERASASIGEFVAPATTSKEWADEIKRYQ